MREHILVSKGPDFKVYEVLITYPKEKNSIEKLELAYQLAEQPPALLNKR